MVNSLIVIFRLKKMNILREGKVMYYSKLSLNHLLKILINFFSINNSSSSNNNKHNKCSRLILINNNFTNLQLTTFHRIFNNFRINNNNNFWISL